MSTSCPLVSICIPCYNSAAYVEETISCLLSQSYQNLEVILIDDGSTDHTEKVLGTIKDQRFRYVVQENKGAAAARNKAYQLSKGDYIKFMDANDLINFQCIESQLSRLHDDPDCIASAKWGRFYKPDHSDFMLAKEKVWMDMPGINWLINSLIETGANMMQPGIFLLPRKIVEKAGPWNQSLSLIDDFDFMVRVITICSSVLFCEEALLMYRSGIPGSLSGKKTSKHIQSAFDSLNLGIERILQVKNDEQSRRACANIYKRWSTIFYPEYEELYGKIEAKIDQLGGASIPLVGSKLTRLFTMTIGWKNTKKLKKFLRPNSNE